MMRYIGIAALVYWFCQKGEAADKLVAEKDPVRMEWLQSDSTLALKLENKILWKFCYGKDLSKPYFELLAIPGGTVITVDRPPDHPWHHGLWFSWKYINGVNFWEENRKTGKSEGTLLWEKPKITTLPDYSAVIDMELKYYPAADKPPVMREQRRIIVSPLAGDGSYSIDFIQKFAALQQVKLDRTPLAGEPGGKYWGGYAGFSVRLARDVTKREISTDKKSELGNKSRFHEVAGAVEYSGDFGGTIGGITLLDNPANPGAPTVFYIIDDPAHKFYYASPAVIYRKARLLKKDETLTLKYRAIVHQGRWGQSKIIAERDEYIGE